MRDWACGAVALIDRLGQRVGLCAQLREPEIEHLHASLREHDVGRLEVAVNDADAMRGGERIGYLRSDPQDFLERHRARRLIVRRPRRDDLTGWHRRAG